MLSDKVPLRPAYETKAELELGDETQTFKLRFPTWLDVSRVDSLSVQP